MFTITGGRCHKYHLSRQNTSFCRDKTFIAINICRDKRNFTKLLSRQACFCRDKHVFCLDKKHLLSLQNFCRDKYLYFCRDKNILSEQKFCRGKHTFVATKHVFCRDKHMFVATKMVLVATPANDSSLAFLPSLRVCCKGKMGGGGGGGVLNPSSREECPQGDCTLYRLCRTR